MANEPLHLFEGFGIELEYMIVDADSLAVAPRADWLMTHAAGELTGEYERGPMAWNNELALHVVEFKTNGPVATLEGVAEQFQGEVTHARTLLESENLTLLPTAMHPWLNPDTDIRLWPHDLGPVYAAFDRIFDCRGHGWGNLQSMHINLPFADDQEFGRLHAAVRAVLPILPGLAASSPLADGLVTGLADTRLEVYRSNCRRVPSVTGAVIPEQVYTMDEYRNDLLGRIYADLEEHDPEGTLRHEWVNARGAIARFDRMAIEIRVIDIQECPRADLAIANVVSELVRALAEERWCSIGELQALEIPPLEALFRAHVKDGDRARIDNRDYLRALGYTAGGDVSSARLWTHLLECLAESGRVLADTGSVMERILSQGCLARRILRSVGDGSRAGMTRTYRKLVGCLADGNML